jgi:phenylalanyl-tRNA synthetase beta chain
MKVSLSWLKDYVAIEEDVTKLADALTMAGLEVDALTDRYAFLESVVAGRIIEMGRHPHADALSVVKVDVGSSTKTIVCGATHIKKGDLVPVALVGSELPSGDTIEAGHIRGQVSEGMLCSEAELAIGTDRSGILLLPESATPGAGVAEVLNLSDTIIEFDLTPNRSDCLSIIGIAREVAAILGVPLKYPEVTLPTGDVAIEELTSVTIEAPDHCPRYAARVIQDVKIGPSPFWMQERLHSIGLRAISNVVDVTNFVMMEMGQPLHAFDFDRLAEHRIVVRTAQAGQVFSTLDGMERILADDMLMICDGRNPVAVAGIMGGLESEIEDDTANVLIESAYFNPTSVRRTAKRLGVTTESSYRFERGVDPEGITRALNRAAQLMAQTAGGRLAAGMIDNYPRPIPQRTIELSVQRTNRLLGTQIDRQEISAYLRSVELDAEPVDDDTLRVVPPTFRVDIERPEDLMEEVARLKGYDQIPTTHPLTHVVACAEDKHLLVRRRLRQVLSGCGFSEIVTYSFIDEGACDRLLLDADDPRRQMLPIVNPLTEDQTVMRTSLLPGLLATVHLNSTQGNYDLRMFEVGKVFLSPAGADRDQLPEEVHMVSGLWTGARFDKTWHAKGEEVDFYDIKGVVESLCAALQIRPLRFAVRENGEFPHLRTGRVAKVHGGDEPLGVLGELKRQVLDNFALRQTAYCFDLNLDKLVDHATEEKRAMPLSRFPSTTRDLALIVDDAVEAQKVLDFVDGLGEDLIGKGEVFDVYKGKKIPHGKKSVAFRFTYRSFERSLTDSEVNKIHENIARKVLDAFHAELPSS